MAIDSLLIDVSCIRVDPAQDPGHIERVADLIRSSNFSSVRPILLQTGMDEYRVIHGHEVVLAAKKIYESTGDFEQIEALVLEDEEAVGRAREQFHLLAPPPQEASAPANVEGASLLSIEANIRSMQSDITALKGRMDGLARQVARIEDSMRWEGLQGFETRIIERLDALEGKMARRGAGGAPIELNMEAVLELFNAPFDEIVRVFKEMGYRRPEPQIKGVLELRPPGSDRFETTEELDRALNGKVDRKRLARRFRL